MQMAFTDDQIRFREMVARFLQEKSPTTATRKIIETDSGYDPDVWQQLCTEIGLAGTHLPEVYGGFGFGPVELGITLEEMGRHLYAGPFFASAVMASYAILHLSDEETRGQRLPELAAGSCLSTLVLDSLDAPAQLGKRIYASDNTLNGEAPLVIDGQAAEHLYVIAENEDGLGFYTLATNANGVNIQPVNGLDPTRKLSRIEFSNAPAQSLGQISQAALTSLWDHLIVALAHEMIGGAQQLLDSTIEYTKIRHQFGRPIGSFQSLKHRCADLLMEVEWAKAATHHAARCLAAGSGEEYLPSMVKAMASDVYMKAAKEAIQMRGGIGFTWEEDTQLWYKRAKSSEVFLGTPSYHREQMMTLIEAGELTA